MSRGTLRGSLPENVLGESADLALARLEAANTIRIEGELVRLARHSPTLDDETRAAVDRIRSEALAAGLEPPSPRDWAQQLGISAERFRDLAAYLEREGDLLRAPGDLWFAKASIESLRERVVAHFDAHGEIDTQTYKSLIGTSRRTAMPLMELFDELHLTRRAGDVRVLRNG
jgi:selenocysteine-specific elongation factor